MAAPQHRNAKIFVNQIDTTLDDNTGNPLADAISMVR